MPPNHRFIYSRYQPDSPVITGRDREGDFSLGRLVSTSEASSEYPRVVARAARSLANEIDPPWWMFWRRFPLRKRTTSP